VKRTLGQSAILLMGLGLAGCVHAERGTIAPSAVTLDTSGVTPKVDYLPLAAVLDEVVDEDGYIHLEAFQDFENEGRPNEFAGWLSRQEKLLAVTGPTATPALFATARDRLVYWYNARSTWAVSLAYRLGRARRVTEKNNRPPLTGAHLRAYSFPLDGRTMTLADIDAAIEVEGGYRAVASAPGTDLLRAKLPKTPFGPKTIDEEIARRLEAFVDDEKRFVIDASARAVLYPPVLWRHRKEILARHVRLTRAPRATLTTALLPEVSGSAHRRLQEAVGFRGVENPAPGELAIVEE
jgi:hypothetical protein